MTPEQLRAWLSAWPNVQSAILDLLVTRGVSLYDAADMLGWLAAMSVQVDRVKQVVEDTHER
jgi:hypothetical protein